MTQQRICAEDKQKNGMTILLRNESICKLTNSQYAVNIKYSKPLLRHTRVLSPLSIYSSSSSPEAHKHRETEPGFLGGVWGGEQGGENALVEIQLTAKAISECAKCCQQAWCLCMKYRQYDWPIGSHCQPDGWSLKRSKAAAIRAQSISLLKEIQGLNRGETLY